MRDLLADAERALAAAAGDSDPQASRTATVLRDALAPRPPTGSMPARGLRGWQTSNCRPAVSRRARTLSKRCCRAASFFWTSSHLASLR